MIQKDSKVCVVCGRTFTYRKKWEKVWDQVKYCSDRCRGEKASEWGMKIEEEILARVSATSGTICPSEVARALTNSVDPEIMEQVRRVARRLAHAGKIVISQRGQRVEPDEFRGPIRIGRVGK